MSLLWAMLAAAQVASAGIQFVGGATAAQSGSSSPSISLTGLTGGLASSPSPGDLVVVAVESNAAGNLALSASTSGFTQVVDLHGDDTVDANLLVAYKIMSGSPDSSVAASLDGATNSAIAVWVFRGVNASNPLDVAATSATGANSDRPNPPSITPVTAGAVIVAIGGGAGSGDVTGALLAQSGSELSNFLTAGAYTGASTPLIAGGWVAWASGAFDPAGLVGGANSGSSAWAGVTLALRPA